MIPLLLLLGLLLPSLPATNVLAHGESARAAFAASPNQPPAAPVAVGGVMVAALSPAEPAAEPLILILGDSLSAAFGIDLNAGWVRLLEQRLREKGLSHRIVNASISGETTAGGRTRLPRLLAEHRPSLVLLELGANDGLRGFGLGVLRDNLSAMIRQARTAGSQVLVAGLRLPPNYGVAYTDGFQAVFREVATAEQVPYISDFLAGIPENRSLMQVDDLHPNAAAQPRILDNIWPSLEPLLLTETATLK